MIMFRMFCALHTPAEEHQCNFDYQVSKLKVSLWWWCIWLYGVDDTEWFNPQWFWRNEKTVISIQRPRPGSRLKRRTPRWGVDNISFILFKTFYMLHIIHNPIKLQGGRWESEEVVNVETWGAFGGSFLLFDHFLRLVMLWKHLCQCSLTFVSDIHWCAINWTQPCQIVLQMYIAQLIYMLGCWVMCPTTVKICAADVKYVLRSWRMAAAAQIYANTTPHQTCANKARFLLRIWNMCCPNEA